MNLREEMRFNGIIGHNRFLINEMAAKHLVDVIKDIKDGKIEQAVKDYKGPAGGVRRTVNVYIKNNPGQDNKNFEEFISAFIEKAKKEGADKPTRQYVKKTAEIGKQGQQAAKKRNEKMIVKKYQSIEEFEKNLKDNISDAELKSEMKDTIEDLSVGGIHDDDKDIVKKLKKFISNNEGKKAAVKALADVLWGGKISTRDFGLTAERPEGGITPESIAKADERREKIKKKEEEEKKKKGKA